MSKKNFKSLVGVMFAMTSISSANAALTFFLEEGPSGVTVSAVGTVNPLALGTAGSIRNSFVPEGMLEVRGGFNSFIVAGSDPNGIGYSGATVDVDDSVEIFLGGVPAGTFSTPTFSFQSDLSGNSSITVAAEYTTGTENTVIFSNLIPGETLTSLSFPEDFETVVTVSAGSVTDTVRLVSVPEPSSVLLLALGGVSLARRRR